MELEEQLRVDNNKLWERLNEQLSSENKVLRELLLEERKTNVLLLKRIGVKETVAQTNMEFNPVGGYTPLRDRIKEAEAKSRQEAENEAIQP